MFKSKPNNKGRRTFFDNDDSDTCYIKHSSTSRTAVISKELFDFNQKIKYISLTLNRIVYFDYNIDCNTLKREYNIIIFN